VQLPRLKEWREFRGLTQPELADRAGLSLRTVFNYEHGGNALPNNARKLAAALGVDIGDLISEEARPKGSAPPALQTSLFNGDVSDEERRSLGKAYLAARREAHKLLHLHRHRIGALANWWQAHSDGLTPQEVVSTLREVGGLMASGIFEIRIPWSPEVDALVVTAAIDEADRFEVVLIGKAVKELEAVAVKVIGRADADDLLRGIERMAPEIKAELEANARSSEARAS
jgi:transcriptional regulator with XRE-family HTH domain